MTENTEYVSCHVAVNGRPSWPYEDWKYSDFADAEKENVKSMSKPIAQQRNYMLMDLIKHPLTKNLITFLNPIIGTTI